MPIALAAIVAICVNEMEPPLPDAPAMPATIASAMIPRTSSSTAAPRMVTPSGVSSLSMSPSTRAVIPMLVAARIAPTNNAGPQRERRQEADDRNERCRTHVTEELFQVGMQPRDEQEDDAGELGEVPDDIVDRPLPRLRRGGEERDPVPVQGELDHVPEQVGPEDDAGHQLADDAGDVDLLRQPPEDLGGDEDRGKLEEHEHDLEHAAVLGDGLELVEVGGDDEGLGSAGVVGAP